MYFLSQGSVVEVLDLPELPEEIKFELSKMIDYYVE